MKSVVINKLSKYFRIYKKEAGICGSLKSLFHSEYSDSKAVDNISFEIDRVELIGLIGPRGAENTMKL